METEAQTSMTRMTTHRILALTKRGLLFLLLAFSPFQLFTLSPLHLHAQGIPFFRNFMPEDYHANSFNFDIETDINGNVFLANFEGLLFYDHAQWQILHTPGITRVTITVRTSDGTLWIGGYNFLGKVQHKANGEVYLQRVAKPDLFNGEVIEIYEKDGKVRFIVNEGAIYQIDGDSITLFKQLDKQSTKIGVFDAIDPDAAERGEANLVLDDIITEEPLGNGLTAVIKKGEGVIITNDKNERLYTINADNGLCSNDVAYIAYDGRGTLWGATAKGLFAIKVPSAYTHYSSHEGLPGNVLSIGKINDTFYAGTDEGLFRLNGARFMQIPGVTHSCWALTKSGSGLLAATAEGVFRIFPDGSARQLTNNNSLAVLDVGTHFYSGEFDAVYLVSADGKVKKKVCQIENVKKIIKDNKGIIWLQSTNGIVGSITPDKDTVELYKTKDQIASMRSIVDINGRVVVMEAESTKPFPYPFYSYTDDSGVCWLTNNEGKALYGWKNGQLLNDVNRLLAPFNDITIRSMYRQGDKLWIGSDNGLTIVNTKVQDPYLNQKPELRIRSIILGGDSILWGGFGKMPESLPTLKHDEHNLKFTFSLCSTPVTGNNLYRYRLNDGNWSTWSTNTEASFVNLSHGTYTFYVQARDAMNRPSEIAYIQFEISPPFYLRWYMYLLYFLLLVTILYFLFKLRLRRLEKDKKQLELIIKDRTAEVVRLEKMATAGKLTQGLIDRILNPLNYINNFSKLSEGLIKDVKANIEDDKDNMDQENYEDTMDVLDMLTGNLQKVSEHGQNTTRTLKAMEEILKDRSGGKVPMDMAAVIRQDELFLKEYYKQEIAQYGIQIIFDYPSEGLQIVGNAELLSKTMMSLLGNAVYATVKKAQRTPYTPEIALRATTEGGHVKVSVRDNGIGIESTIIDKIFDPFFTTKTTGEASGVGLYLSHEIIQDHGGNLSVESVKDEYSEFTFIIPVKKA